jgi:CubicO group peptidase (beta-lactamase class C family)
MHDTRSAAKSLTATLIGAAMHAKAPLQLSTPVYAAMNGGQPPADLEPQKRTMTLEHLLMMRSGFFCDDSNPDAPGNEDAMLDQTERPTYYRYTLRCRWTASRAPKASTAASIRISPSAC